jgi:hypothetical protein
MGWTGWLPMVANDGLDWWLQAKRWQVVAAERWLVVMGQAVAIDGQSS